MNIEDYIPVDPLEGGNIRCYRYLGSHWMDSLSRMELKTSDVDSFNDIFDSRGATCGKLTLETVRRHVNDDVISQIPGMTPELSAKLASHYADQHMCDILSNCLSRMIESRAAMHESRVICLSAPESPDADALMWSHYANHWSGVRLGFELLYDMHREIDFKKATTPYVLDYVRYSEKRPVLDLSKLESVVGDAYFTSCFRWIMLTKSPAWKYEHEWRMLVIKDQAEPRYVNNSLQYFWKFHPRLLKTVDIGPCMPQDESTELIAFLRHVYPHVQIRRVVLSQNDYGFQYMDL